MSLKTFFVFFMIAMVSGGGFLLGENPAKFEKSYILNYSLNPGTEFTVNNNFYFIQYQKKENVTKKFQCASGYMVLRYQVEKKSHDGLTLRVEYRDKYKENFYKNELSKKDFTPFKGGKIIYQMSPLGDVGEFKDFDKLNTKLSGGRNVSIENLKEEIIHLFPHLPEKPVKLGDKWTTSFAGGEGQESFSLEYLLLDEVKINGIECLKIKANYKTENRYPVTAKNGKKLVVDARDIGHDIYYFAYKKGFLLMRKSIGNGVTDVFDSDSKKVDSRLNDVLYETDVVFQ